MVKELLPLASKIAREFDNIPGLPHAEIEMAAQEALARAASLFDPAKGDFSAYAARAMRNALRDLYDRQLRHHQHHIYDLDVPATLSSDPRIQAVQALHAKPVDQDAAALESSTDLGAWLPLPGSASPFPFSTGIPKEFFRLRK